MRHAISIVLLLVGTAAAQPAPQPVPRPEPIQPAGKPEPAPGPRGEPVPGAPKPEPPPPPAAPKPASPFDAYTGGNERGRELFEAAKQQMRDGNQAAACTKFAESFAQEEAISTQLNLARCRENEGKYAEAYRLFHDAARRSEGIPDRAKIATDAAAALEERLATIVIRLAAPIAPGTVVTVNDRLVDTAPEVRERVDAGNVVVTAKGPTGVTSTRTFRVFVMNTINVDVPTLQERTAGRQPLFIAGSVILVTGGLLAVGAGSGGVRLAGGVAIAGGVAMFLLAPRQRVTVVPMLTSNAATGGVALTGRF